MRPLAAFALFMIATLPLIGQEPAPSLDEATLREYKLPADGPGLLEFFRGRTLSPDRAKQFQDYLKHLGSGVYAERSKAMTGLVKMGAVVRPLLQQAIGSGTLDLETLRRAQQLLQQLPEGQDNMLAMTVARQIARLKPPDAAPVLLDYLPFLPTETVRQEVQSALNAVAGTKEGQAALIAALAGADIPRRAAAAEALIRAGAVDGKRVEALLKDAQRPVRFQAALAVAEKHDPAGLPVLINLLPDLPLEQASLTLDLLQRAAGDDAPPVGLYGTDTPAQIRTAWQKWYDGHAKGLNLAERLKKKEHGLTVITSAGNGAKSWVVALGPDGKEVWRFAGPRGAIDMQVLGRDRLLVAEYAGQKVTERNSQGDVLWEKQVEQPVACQRLGDGTTFIATKTHLMIVDPGGREVFTGFKDHDGLVTAHRLRDGRMVAVTEDGTCYVLDPAGRPLKQFPLGPLHKLGSHVEVLPNGHILAGILKENRVAEFDLTGRVHWEVKAIGPSSAQRLSNGNTLVVSMRLAQIIEVTPTGEEVWDYFTDGRPWRARRW